MKTQKHKFHGKKAWLLNVLTLELHEGVLKSVYRQNGDLTKLSIKFYPIPKTDAYKIVDLREGNYSTKINNKSVLYCKEYGTNSPVDSVLMFINKSHVNGTNSPVDSVLMFINKSHVKEQIKKQTEYILSVLTKEAEEKAEGYKHSFLKEFDKITTFQNKAKNIIESL